MTCRKGHDAGCDPDGHCSECRRIRLRKQYADNIERERARGRARSKSPEVRAAIRERWAREPTRFRMYGLKSRIKNPQKTMLRAAQYRAKIGEFPCTISETDIVIPERCPLLGIKLTCAKGKGGVKDSSPSLDKIIPELGYVPGNVWVISHKANSMKRNATLAEFVLMAKNWEQRAWPLTKKVTGTGRVPAAAASLMV